MQVRVLEFLADNTKGKPNEDSLLYSPALKLFAVADGATRFVPEGKEYPADPSPAKVVSSIFCNQVTSFTESRISEGTIREVFRDVNDIIRLVNEKRGITKETTDYLENDFVGCVAVMGGLVGNTLHYGYIGDCGLLVYDSSTLLPVFITQNDLRELEDFRDAFHVFVPPRKSKAARMIHWNQFWRNHPKERYLTFGSLTGQEEALAYVKTGSVTLAPQDVAVFFSDGALPYLFSGFFRETLWSLVNSEKNYAQKVSELNDVVERSMPHLRKRGFKNLDDDKALIALQLA